MDSAFNMFRDPCPPEPKNGFKAGPGPQLSEGDQLLWDALRAFDRGEKDFSLMEKIEKYFGVDDQEDDPHKVDMRVYLEYHTPETFTRGDARFMKMEMQLNQALKWLKTSANPEVERYITYVRDKLSYLAGHEDRWRAHSDPMPSGPEKFRPVDGVELEHLNSPACPPSHNLKCNNCLGPLEVRADGPYVNRRLHDILLRHLRVIEEKGVDYWCPKCLQTYLIPMALHDYHNNLKNSSETPQEKHTNS